MSHELRAYKLKEDVYYDVFAVQTDLIYLPNEDYEDHLGEVAYINPSSYNVWLIYEALEAEEYNNGCSGSNEDAYLFKGDLTYALYILDQNKDNELYEDYVEFIQTCLKNLNNKECIKITFG